MKEKKTKQKTTKTKTKAVVEKKEKKSKKTSKEEEKKLIESIEINRKIPRTIQESLNQIKEEMKEHHTQPTEIEVRKTPFVLDKVYLQSITFEIASMRQALDRIGQKLDKLEKELAAHRKGEL
ncbi:MAG: hypothetical protein N3D10_02050 [Candidatus Micrarchaeota archaeon]|nr:hypothetical protein [Candidatus Micrarchaeota archaeon]